ncbi:MAG: B12-binding domain-containing radical SAM protein [Pirellulales bacterium]|nr:B12-binding domain-containing radical SAM protein [Pirellulales bacterium]
MAIVETHVAVDGVEAQGHRAGAAVAPRHVTLIRPALCSPIGNWTAAVTPPLGLAYLAAVLEENGTSVAIVDGLGEGIDQHREADGYRYHGLAIDDTIDRIDPRTDLIGVSCMFSQDWPWLRSLITAIRERFPATPIVAGGEHITALPHFCLEDCPALDYCVLGEGEETLVELVNQLGDVDGLRSVPGVAYLQGGQCVQSAPRRRIRAVDALPYPAWHLFPMEVYLDSRNSHGMYLGRTIGVLATRGCPYKCTFCSNPVMYGNLWMPRSPANVLDEIEHFIERYGITNVDFYDLTAIVRRSWILEFCRLIEERGLKFTWQLPSGTRSEVLDEQVCAALHRTGCRYVCYAPESGSRETLEIVKKQVDLNKLTKSIRGALAERMSVKVNLVVGFPHERRRHVWQTIRFGWKLAILGAHDVSIYVFSPYPGSALFDQLRAEGRIPRFDAEYFRSLAAFMNPFAVNQYCRNIGGRELGMWRLFGMLTFYAFSYGLRPVRFWRLIRNLIKNESGTLLDSRLGAILRRPKAKVVETAKSSLRTEPVVAG